MNCDCPPEDLLEAIEAFRDYARERRWNTMDGAYNFCAIASDEFIEQTGLGRIVHFDWPHAQHAYPLQAGGAWHQVVEYEGWIVDWTARQYDWDADFPMMYKLDVSNFGTREKTRYARTIKRERVICVA